ncbi:hypothetical protein SNE40_013512 [Patella caerulea]|uniref:Uncharacterized protein n=1 Tax=Patella caerulea TaxID=87958 RepID=A0AAN8JBR7_PATCE
MSDVINCSYVDQNSVYHDNWCQGETNHCCRSGWQLICSAETCDYKNPITDVSSYVFWLILAGIAAFGIIILSVTYLVCKYRVPREDAESENQNDLFEETICETKFKKITKRGKPEVTESELSSFLMRTETKAKAATTQKSTIPVRSLDVRDRKLMSPRDSPAFTHTSGLSPRYSSHDRRTPRAVNLGFLPDVG